MNLLDDPRALLRHLYDVAVQRALPLHNTAAHLPPPPRGRTLVLGAGKAGGAMAHAVEALWPADAPLSGLVVTRYGHTPPRPQGLAQRIEVVEAAHPVPDAAGLQAAQRILALTQGLTEDDLVLCLISGGGSALLTLPCEGLTLSDKQRINRQLLDSGAHIGEMNTVRKHLSAIKGGRLASACAPAHVVTLTISDVPGDDVSVIASGPTVADATTCADALDILHRYGIEVPPAVKQQLEAGALETPKPGDPRLARCQTHLIATPQQSLEAAAEAARALGLQAYILSDEIEGESREIGRVHAALARSTALGRSSFQAPCVILSGGETTVTVRPRAEGQPKGRGGRAGEFCMGLAQALGGQPDVWALAADTDGIDGVEDNAGALVTPDTLVRAGQQGLRLADHLARNDAYGFFEALGDLVFTGPTHTNVNDFRALLVR
ncbi:MAG TPA: glycerate kinase [Hydrogenophaga sp.]|uniref:glycerate kinase type-2 family protein n=1 Tax=Hydrogenophaga sp. TaxID=1904254 RepID=UPI002CF910B4|nr:glycerate kinase [Hydrogenophaga sp.]HMN91741.1 glycerate kinase [Hydrogenophaga sp.]HMP10542.1 glycerate kinase [Hydrogenophaga sp.]